MVKNKVILWDFDGTIADSPGMWTGALMEVLIAETVKYLRVSISTIRKYVKTGKLPSYRQGHIIRLKQSDIDAFLSPSRVEPPKSGA